MRSGISIGRHQADHQIVSPSEIMCLNDLEAYVRLPSGLPITKATLVFKARGQIAVSFAPRTIDGRNLNEINSMIESMERDLPPTVQQRAGLIKEDADLQW